MSEDRMLREALDAIRQGQRRRARDLLTRLLRADGENSTYWLYMSSVVDSTKERVYCLQQALRLDPRSQAAKRGLVLLGARPPDEKLVPVRPVRQRQWDLEALGAFGPEEEQVAKRRLPMRRILALGGVGVIALGLILFGVFGNPFDGSALANRPTPLPLPLGAAGPSATYLPTPTPRNPTPTPTFVGPTPLWMLLPATYTPTPRYVDTPHPSSEAYRTALRALERGDYERAIEFLEQYLQQNPGALDGLYYIGEAYLHLENYLRAQEYFTRATLFDETFGPAYVGLARANLGLNPNSIVSDELENAIRYAPDYADAHIERGRYRLSRKNPAGALDDLEAAEELAPESALLYLYKAQALFQLERYLEALEAARRANELDSTLLESYLVFGQALHANGQTAQAIGPLQTYVIYDEENAEGWYILGQAYLEAGAYQQAVEALDRALALDSNLYEVNYYRGVAYLHLEDVQSALTNLDNVLRVSPDWFEARLYHGWGVLLSGDERGGYLEINASQSQAKTQEQLALLYFYRAQALEAVDEEQAAISDWNALLDLPAEEYPEEWTQTAKAHLRSLGAPTPTPDNRTATPFRSPTPTRTPSATP